MAAPWLQEMVTDDGEPWEYPYKIPEGTGVCCRPPDGTRWWCQVTGCSEVLNSEEGARRHLAKAHAGLTVSTAASQTKHHETAARRGKVKRGC